MTARRFPTRLHPGWARPMGLLLLLGAGLLYLATLDNGLTPQELEGGDLITHQYAQVQARPSNAPGYPLYTMGGWLWFHGLRGGIRLLLGSAWPNPIPILSSYSTLWALIALALLYAILLHLSRGPAWPEGHWPLAWLLTAFYGVTYFFWYYATTTEQYSSAVAHTLAILYLYLRWEESRERDPGRGERLLLGMAFLAGLSLAHMVTVALVVPPLLAVVLWQEPRLLRRPGLVAAALLLAGLPLVSYVYVYVRGAAHPEWWGQGSWNSPQEWFWSFVSTAQGREEMSWGLQPGAPLWANGFPELIWQELSLPILLLGMAGWGRLGRPRAVLLWGTWLLYLAFCWVDRLGNWFQVILPAYPLILLGLVPWALAWTGRLRGSRPWLSRLPWLFLLGALLWRVDASWPQVDSRDRPGDTGLARPALLLDQPLPQGAGLFAEQADALGLDYLIQIWGIRPDLQVVSSPQAREYLAQGRPVLSTWQVAPLLLAELPDGAGWRLQSQTPDWVRLVPADQDAPPLVPQVREDRAVGPIRWLGYAGWPGPTGAPVFQREAGDLDVVLFWQVDGPVSDAWWVSVRALRNGQLLATAPEGRPAQQDSPGPVRGLRPFTQLPPDTLVADGYRLPGGLAADELWILLYRPVGSGFQNLGEFRVRLEDR